MAAITIHIRKVKRSISDGANKECPSHLCGIVLLVFVWKQRKLSLASDCAHTNKRGIYAVVDRPHCQMVLALLYILFFVLSLRFPSHPFMFF